MLAISVGFEPTTPRLGSGCGMLFLLTNFAKRLTADSIYINGLHAHCKGILALCARADKARSGLSSALYAGGAE